MTELSNNVRRKFVRHVYSKMKEIATGSGFDRVYGDKPQGQFFVGSLCNLDPSSRLGAIRTKVAPVRMGVEFLLDKRETKTATLEVIYRAAVFYKVNPSYEEQMKAAIKKNGLNREELLLKIKEQAQDASEGKENQSLGAPPRVVFKKLKIPERKLKCKFSEFMQENFEGVFDFSELKEVIEEALDVCNSDDNLYRFKKRKVEEINSVVPLSALVDEQSFKKYMAEWGEKDASPSWNFKIFAKTSDFDLNHIKVSVIFENTCDAKDNDHVDNFLFDTFLKVDVSGADVKNFVLGYLNDHYRYNGEIEASGINCEAARKGNSIWTEHMPFFEQFRIKTREDLKLKFNDLSSEKSVSELKKIASAMKNYLADYESQEKTSNFKSEIGKRKFQEDVEIFRNEIKRFEYGIEVLEKYPTALKSFKKMNETFFNTGKNIDKQYDSWRVFQIIFIVMNIPDVISTEYKELNSNFEQVEVLCFPTGGGKTETYLGLVIFTIFFDRYRGKKAGTSAMIKFPLRLLSLQQIQRIANVLAQAELLRRADSSINGKDLEQFSLGYFVGDVNTPNELIKKASMFGGEDKDLLSPIVAERERIIKGEISMDDESLEGRKYLILSKCPFCGSKEIMIDADVQRIRLLHRCMNKSCSEDELPVYVSDVEIYRYLPSFIISTLDKVAICGWQKNFRNLFGQVINKCPLHGYSNSEDCTERWSCKEEKSKFEKVKLYDPVPTMQIQDEMHLVRESLGTFNSHYETFLEELEKELTNGRRSVKILTATATVSEYRVQTDHLYCRDAAKFPSQGRSLQESFYAYTDYEDLNRIIIGITPHNKTLIFTMLAVQKIYHELVHRYSENPTELLREVELGISEAQANEMLEDYKIKLSYHLAKNDGDAVSNSIRTMTNRDLREIGVKEIVQRPLTGDVSFNDVRIALDKIENPKDDEDKIDMIVATSMISHGVDLNKLNFITFMGMPTSTSEYVQASSRVGRIFPGIVVVVFNATRERDQSYYKFFTKFHEYRDLLIEAVPINRWAKFSVKKTLPGIFTGAILNYFDSITMSSIKKSINMSKQFEKAYSQRLFTEDDIKKFILKSYKTGKHALGIDFEDVIKQRTESYIYEITQSLGNTFIAKAISEEPMTSLRDVDEPIDINLSAEGAMLLGRFRAGRTLSYDSDDEPDNGGN